MQHADKLVCSTAAMLCCPCFPSSAKPNASYGSSSRSVVTVTNPLTYISTRLLTNSGAPSNAAPLKSNDGLSGQSPEHLDGLSLELEHLLKRVTALQETVMHHTSAMEKGRAAVETMSLAHVKMIKSWKKRKLNSKLSPANKSLAVAEYAKWEADKNLEFQNSIHALARHTTANRVTLQHQADAFVHVRAHYEEVIRDVKGHKDHDRYSPMVTEVAVKIDFLTGWQASWIEQEEQREAAKRASDAVEAATPTPTKKRRSVMEAYYDEVAESDTKKLNALLGAAADEDNTGEEETPTPILSGSRGNGNGNDEAPTMTTTAAGGSHGGGDGDETETETEGEDDSEDDNTQGRAKPPRAAPTKSEVAFIENLPTPRLKTRSGSGRSGSATAGSHSPTMRSGSGRSVSTAGSHSPTTERLKTLSPGTTGAATTSSSPSPSPSHALRKHKHPSKHSVGEQHKFKVGQTVRATKGSRKGAMGIVRQWTPAKARWTIHWDDGATGNYRTVNLEAVMSETKLTTSDLLGKAVLLVSSTSGNAQVKSRTAKLREICGGLRLDVVEVDGGVSTNKKMREVLFKNAHGLRKYPLLFRWPVGASKPEFVGDCEFVEGLYKDGTLQHFLEEYSTPAPAPGPAPVTPTPAPTAHAKEVRSTTKKKKTKTQHHHHHPRGRGSHGYVDSLETGMSDDDNDDQKTKTSPTTKKSPTHYEMRLSAKKKAKQAAAAKAKRREAEAAAKAAAEAKAKAEAEAAAAAEAAAQAQAEAEAAAEEAARQEAEAAHAAQAATAMSKEIHTQKMKEHQMTAEEKHAALLERLHRAEVQYKQDVDTGMAGGEDTSSRAAGTSTHTSLSARIKRQALSDDHGALQKGGMMAMLGPGGGIPKLHGHHHHPGGGGMKKRQKSKR